MISRDMLINFINKTLEVEEHKDPWLFNGLQVIGKEKVKKIALGVSPNLEIFQKASRWGADMIILHHGLFGPKISQPINKVLKNRLKILFEQDITLLTYHLFLDKHPVLGNNTQLIKLLGAKKTEKFGFTDNQYWGWQGSYVKGVKHEEFTRRLKNLCGDKILNFPFGPKIIKKFAVVSGGSPYLLNEAITKNLDAYLSGEARESTKAEAKEAGIHYFCLGHYNSEKFGVESLGKFLKQKFPELEIKFIDIPNPL